MSSKETTMNFGKAIEGLKNGRRVTRERWNGKGMFLFLARGSVIVGDGLVRVELFAEDGMPFTEADGHTRAAVSSCIVMKAADDTLVPGWLASQTDMLAEDWVILAHENVHESSSDG